MNLNTRQLHTYKSLSPVLRTQTTCKFFWKAPNPMAITQAGNGTYIEVNEAFTKCMGLPRQEIIGRTSVGCGYILAEQRAMIFNEIKKNGYAQNIELEVRVKNNEAPLRII